YLGASRRKEDWDVRWDAAAGRWLPGRGGAPTGTPAGSHRRDNPFTGFDPNDDLDLKTLRHADGYTGPLLIIHSALHLVAGAELPLQARKPEPSATPPLYCGSRPTGYRPTPDTTPGSDNLTLGRAMAISGAAADPNMGIHQSPALTALMTVFNVRLGWWL